MCLYVSVCECLCIYASVLHVHVSACIRVCVCAYMNMCVSLCGRCVSVLTLLLTRKYKNILVSRRWFGVYYKVKDADMLSLK